MDPLVARLESLVARLAGGAADDGEGVPVSVSEYKAYYEASVQPFIDACNKFDDTKKIGTWASTAMGHLGVVIEMNTQCKKPTDEQWGEILGPIIGVFGEAGNPDPKGSAFPQEKAFAEALGCVNWVTDSLPRPLIVGALEAADFYLIKALTACKDKDDPEKTDRRAYVNSLKNMVNKLAEYVVAFWKTGLTWKPKGIELSEFKSGAAPAASGGPASVEDRLEACIEALERHALAAAGDDGDGPAASVIAWGEFMDATVKPFLATCEKIDDAKQIGKWTDTVMNHMSTIMKAASQCSKPGQDEFMTFLGPIPEVMGAATGSPRTNFERAFSEGIQSLNWMFMDLTKPHVMGSLEASDFYLTKVLTAAKDQPDPLKTDMRSFVKEYKAMLSAMAQYCFDHHKTGLSWKMRDGVPLKDFKA